MSKIIAAASVTSLLLLGSSAAYAQTTPSITRQAVRPEYRPPTPPIQPVQPLTPPSVPDHGQTPTNPGSAPHPHAPNGYYNSYGYPQYPGPNAPLPTPGTYYANPYDPYNPYDPRNPYSPHNPYNPYGYGSGYYAPYPANLQDGYPTVPGYDTGRRRK